jgi:ABC-2 type transport system ATP-binding protein
MITEVSVPVLRRTDPAIRVEKLTKRFGSRTAVDGLSLEVPTGTIFGFLGPNGAGKTTSINLLLGLLEPTAGRAEVLGCDIRSSGDIIRTGTGALLEHTGLYEQLTAEENLEFYGRAYRMSTPQRESRIEQLLTGMGLWDRRNDRIGIWSRGMKQRLALARALLHSPSLLFLDEPTAGLDVVAANEVREELVSLSEREGITVFLTTHNMTEAERICDRVAVIRAGALVAVGKPSDLRTRGAHQVMITGRGFDESLLATLGALPQVETVAADNGGLRLDVSDGADVAGVVGAIVGAGGLIEEVRRGTASLEEVFLTLMEEET